MDSLTTRMVETDVVDSLPDVQEVVRVVESLPMVQAVESLPAVQEVIKIVESVPEYSKLMEFLKEELRKNPEVVAKDLMELVGPSVTSCVPCTFLQTLLPFLSKKVVSPK